MTDEKAILASQARIEATTAWQDIRDILDIAMLTNKHDILTAIVAYGIAMRAVGIEDASKEGG